MWTAISFSTYVVSYNNTMGEKKKKRKTDNNSDATQQPVVCGYRYTKQVSLFFPVCKKKEKKKPRRGFRVWIPLQHTNDTVLDLP